MSTGKLVVVAVAVGLAVGGIGAALADGRQAAGGPPVQLADVADARKNDADDEAAVVNDDDDGDDTGDGTGDGGTGGGHGDDITSATGTAAGNPSQAAVLVQGRTAAEWMATARLYKQRWLRTKQANNRHAQQVRNLRASLRPQVRPSPGPRVARGGGGGGGGTSSGGGTGGGGGTGSGGGSGGGDT